MSDSTGAWALTLACNRADAEAMPDIGDIFPDLADPPSLNVEEPDPDKPDEWLLTAYFTEMPTPELVTRITGLFPSAADIALAPLPDADWTTLSQRNLEPVRAGRFLVHTAAHADARRLGDIAIAIEAGLAFGTGQHATTHGCLHALDRLANRRQFHNIADLGTGTGVLALAAAKRWRKAHTIATDIDPVSVDVSRANTRDNHVREGRSAGHIELVTAAGMAHLRLSQRAPYDLIVANILAGPLVDISRDVSRALAPGGVLVLAGLLQSQALRVRAAYRQHGLVPLRQHRRGEWPHLVLTRPTRP
jgi:ribosomal protein L11 methyltransferase